MPEPLRPARRDLLAAAFAASAAALLPARAGAQEADPPLDPRLTVEPVTFQPRRQIFKGQLVRLRQGGRRPGILLLHDLRGVDAFWRGLARRLALDGFVVLLPDLLSPYGATTPETAEEAQNQLARTAPAEIAFTLEAALDLLARHPECTGAVGAWGFVWGGPYALQFALAGRVKAAVSYYAVPPSADRMVEVKVPVQFHWCENDPRTAPLVDALEKRLIGAGKSFESWVYPETQSGFASEPAGRRWNKAAADRAYDRSVFFLRRTLVTGP